MPENNKRNRSSKPATVEASRGLFQLAGPIYLRYTKNKILGTDRHQWTVKPEAKLYIWADWENQFPGSNQFKRCSSTAEPQSHFPNWQKGEIKSILDKKEVWPWPGEGNHLFN